VSVPVLRSGHGIRRPRRNPPGWWPRSKRY